MLSEEIYSDIENQNERELKYSICFIDNWYEGRKLSSLEVLSTLESEKDSIADYLYPHVSCHAINTALEKFKVELGQRVRD